MEDFNWEVVKEAEIELFGDQLDSDAECVSHGNSFDSMLALYGAQSIAAVNKTGSLHSNNSTISDPEGEQTLATASHLCNSKVSTLAQRGYNRVNGSDSEWSSYDGDNIFYSPGQQPTSSHNTKTLMSTSIASQSSSDIVLSYHSPSPPLLPHLNQSNEERNQQSCSHHYSDEDDEMAEVFHTELEFQGLMASHTDPVGKFLKQSKLTAQEAVAFNIQDKLLSAPRKPRTKYGKRKVISAADRAAINRERNRIHAKATRMRKRLFKEVEKTITEGGAAASRSQTHSLTTADTHSSPSHCSSGASQQFCPSKCQRTRSRSNSSSLPFPI